MPDKFVRKLPEHVQEMLPYVHSSSSRQGLLDYMNICDFLKASDVHCEPELSYFTVHDVMTTNEPLYMDVSYDQNDLFFY